MRCKVSGTGVAQGDGAVLDAPGEQQSQRTSHRGTSSDDAHVLARKLDAVTGEQFDDASRGAGQRAGLVEHETPQRVGGQAVGVLVGVDEPQSPVGVDVFGQWQLDDVSGAGGVLVESTDLGLELVCGDVCGQIDANRLDTHLGAVAVLATDVLV